MLSECLFNMWYLCDMSTIYVSTVWMGKIKKIPLIKVYNGHSSATNMIKGVLKLFSFKSYLHKQCICQLDVTLTK